MSQTDKRIIPPKPSTTRGNGHGKQVPTGPSKKTRDDYVRKVREITRKKPGG